ncbi:MAG: aldo/keto reductase [Methanobacteriota archaeon]|nr:aldo/keto reductase [Candidatus Poseidoniia archaeon]PBO81519.1 MAG: aldo/keto reductase [Euryarchaeota archaeon]
MTDQLFLKMNDNFQIPVVGLGTWKSEPGEATYQAVLDSIEAGYRHIDTARAYGNEESVGSAVRDSGVNRGDVFVTTKLRWEDEGFESTIEACEKSLNRLNCDYIDLYLIHWPLREKRNHSWKAFIELRERGLCKSIGVSNFTIEHLAEIEAKFGILPAVNQVEFHPYYYQKELLDYCNSKNIIIEAYSPLAHAKRLDEPKLGAISEELGKTPAQVLIRWSIQRGMVVLPKSVNKSRIIENFSVFDFDISDSVMAKLDELDESFVTCWDPHNPPPYAPV